MNEYNHIPGEFEGLSFWLGNKDKKPKEVGLGYSAFTEVPFARAGIPLTESQAKDKAGLLSLLESQDSPRDTTKVPLDESKYVNSWERSIFQERRSQLLEEIQTGQEDKLSAIREQALESIGQGSNAEIMQVLSNLADKMDRFMSLILQAEKEEVGDYEEDRSIAGMEVGDSEGLEGKTFDPQEREQEKAVTANVTESDATKGSVPSANATLDIASLNLDKRFRDIQSPELLVNEMMQLLLDLGKIVPGLEPIADKINELA